MELAVVTGANAGIGTSLTLMSGSSVTQSPTASKVKCLPHNKSVLAGMKKIFISMLLKHQVCAGKEVTAGLMEKGCHVIMACRRLDRYKMLLTPGILACALCWTPCHTVKDPV